jgi:hypothetical protein
LGLGFRAAAKFRDFKLDAEGQQLKTTPSIPTITGALALMVA